MKPHGNCSKCETVVPAQNGIATGNLVSATRCNSQWSGFDDSGFYGFDSPSGGWYLQHPYIPAFRFAAYNTAGFAASGGRNGGGQRGGLCPDNMRLIRAQIQQGGWKNFQAVVDTGIPGQKGPPYRTVAAVSARRPYVIVPLTLVTALGYSVNIQQPQ